MLNGCKIVNDQLYRTVFRLNLFWENGDTPIYSPILTFKTFTIIGLMAESTLKLVKVTRSKMDQITQLISLCKTIFFKDGYLENFISVSVK